jgi:hypothetical protein
MNKKILRKIGRCANGAERDSGRIYHAVEGWTAICGAQPGRTSAGWSHEEGSRITCQRCMKRLARLDHCESWPANSDLVVGL